MFAAPVELKNLAKHPPGVDDVFVHVTPFSEYARRFLADMLPIVLDPDHDILVDSSEPIIITGVESVCLTLSKLPKNMDPP